MFVFVFSEPLLRSRSGICRKGPEGTLCLNMFILKCGVDGAGDGRGASRDLYKREKEKKDRQINRDPTVPLPLDVAGPRLRLARPRASFGAGRAWRGRALRGPLRRSETRRSSRAGAAPSSRRSSPPRSLRASVSPTAAQEPPRRRAGRACPAPRRTGTASGPSSRARVARVASRPSRPPPPWSKGPEVASRVASSEAATVDAAAAAPLRHPEQPAATGPEKESMGRGERGAGPLGVAGPPSKHSDTRATAPHPPTPARPDTPDPAEGSLLLPPLAPFARPHPRDRGPAATTVGSRGRRRTEVHPTFSKTRSSFKLRI